LAALPKISGSPTSPNILLAIFGCFYTLIRDTYHRSTVPNQKRNPSLKPVSVSSPGAYSASPSQLTLSSDTTAAFQNPYQTQYTYAPSPHHQQLPTGFGFPQQTQFSPHPLQTQHGLPQQHQQPTPQSLTSVSPTNSRKRRASELGGESALSVSSSSTFTNQPGLVTNAYGGEVLDPGPGPSQTQLPSPVVKKGRTNTPWTPAEEQRLKTMRDAGSSWSEIAKTFPQRTEGSVKKHWYKVRPSGVRLVLARRQFVKLILNVW
jgi:hypothetical protein